jgi:hypothetical protein
MLVTLEDEGILACKNPVDVPWLRVAPVSGALEGGESASPMVTIETDGMAVGDYAANICVGSNDVVTPIVAVPVHLQISSGSCDGSDTVFCDGFDGGSDR